MNKKISDSAREEFRFDDVVLRSDTRELWRAGQLQAIERRSFDLLLYLIRQEGRVVSKEELLQNVWGNQFVSDSVIAQSIMKVRKALGLSGRTTGPIKTIHRIGYRFIQAVEREVHPDPAAQSEGDLPAALQRVLWLNTVVPPDHGSLAWARTGLVPVAHHVMQAHRLQTVSVSPDADPVDAASFWPLARHRLEQEDVHAVVGTWLTIESAQFALTWCLAGAGEEHTRHLLGDSPAELALRAATEIALVLRLHLPQSLTATQREQYLQDLLPLVRAAEQHQLIDRAGPLLLSLADHPRCPPAIAVELAVVLARRHHAAALPQVQRLQALARRDKRPGLDTWSQQCLALYHLYGRQPALARLYATQAEAMLDDTKAENLHPRALYAAGHLRAHLGDRGHAQEHWSRLQATVASSQDPSAAACVDLARTEQLLLEGRHAIDQSPFSDLLLRARQRGQHPLAAWAQIGMGLHHACAGRFDGALEALDAAERCADQSGEWRVTLYGRWQQALLAARMGDRSRLHAYLLRLREPMFTASPLGRALAQWIEARHLALEDRWNDALALSSLTLPQLADFGLWWPEDQWLWTVQAALRIEDRTAALRTLQKAEAGPPGSSPRRAVVRLMKALLACHDRQMPVALDHVHAAQPLARDSFLAPVCQVLLVWLDLLMGQRPGLDRLDNLHHWIVQTRSGRLLHTVVREGLGLARTDSGLRSGIVVGAMAGGTALLTPLTAAEPGPATVPSQLPLPL